MHVAAHLKLTQTLKQLQPNKKKIASKKSYKG